MKHSKQRKIIHVDMDCFYAAIEIRDNPRLAGKPVAVGGISERSVLCTCNYLARQYGIRSAMPTVIAYRRCPDLIVLPVDMPRYRQVSRLINAIFKEFTDLVEPLSLDEAFLDVTECDLYQGSATWIAEAIRRKIFAKEQLTASAGVAPNKFLAKIASSWKKPDGLFVIRPQQVEEFVSQLSVDTLHGVGKVTSQKLHHMDIHTGADIQKLPLRTLVHHFGKLGENLYYQCRGIDERPVQANRWRKSLSVETTFEKDLQDDRQISHAIENLHKKLLLRLKSTPASLQIKSQYLKIKFNDFKLATAEVRSTQPELEKFYDLFNKLRRNNSKSLRLLGLGVHFLDQEKSLPYIQHSLF
ncbi:MULTISPECIES: DNA polymerase IV [unclassified Legionella]|uniref:DNA polymerase IV n=1 Tax=unclassified Legionella TaxID=2622702 RepID=UPI0010554D8D|nr:MULTISPECIES: DNA polymerase IV [unclassified Legionella]MDI9818061.1 DNA polymerase IV [Legionella sp. PL877]